MRMNQGEQMVSFENSKVFRYFLKVKLHD
jgi:hypothetical protein